tara:strand:- start:233 stop:793 length:561 start_codon:yes stop_codon:yes gene_type:complete
MSNELPEGLCKTMVSGGELIATSMYTCAPMFELSRKKIDEKTGRDNYCKTVLLLWGFMQFELNELEDDMFNRMLLISAGVLNRVLAKKEFEPLFYGVNFGPSKLEKDHPELSYEMVEWFHRNDSLPGVQIITTTGKHLFGLAAFSSKLENKHTESFYKMGSLIEENSLGLNVMYSILIDCKIKFNF